LIVKETVNEEEISCILRNPDIYETIAEDGCLAIDKFTIPFDEHQYIGGYVNGEIIALMVYHTYRDGNACHVHVLPKYRKDYALKFGEQSLLFCGTQPLYAEIPDLYKNVLDFAINFDFKIIETVVDGCIKNGVSYNINIMRMGDHVFEKDKKRSW
jgi:hypothetical protein